MIFLPRKLWPAQLLAVVTLVALPLCSPAEAAYIDPTGDFLSSYTGPQNGDLDVVNFDAQFDGTTFTFSSTSNGAIGTTPGGIFVWGVDRGAHTAGFGAFRPGVLFDAVVIANPNGPSRAVVNGVTTVLPSSALKVLGNMISISLPASLLPSTGVSVFDYMVNLWPRSGAGGNTVISDFAPDNSDIAVSFVPEPAAWMILLMGLLGLGAVYGMRQKPHALLNA